MREEREKITCIGEERARNKIRLIISNILEKLSGLIIPNRGSTRQRIQNGNRAKLGAETN
jgi:hypothetical protein